MIRENECDKIYCLHCISKRPETSDKREDRADL